MISEILTAAFVSSALILVGLILGFILLRVQGQ